MNRPNVAAAEAQRNTSSLKTEEWLTTEEAAQYLKLSVGALRNVTSNGLVPYHKLGNRNRYLREDLRNLLLKNRRGVLYGNKN
jgi:excisionase family DNA binding protein